MSAMQQAMTIAAQRAGDAKQGTRTGVVEGYDPDTFSVKVRLQPSGVLTGWIPISTCWVGNGWGFAAAPTIGDAVQVDMAEGSIDAGLMTGSFFNDVERAMGVPSGELWIRHKTGTQIRLMNDGWLEIAAATGIRSAAPIWNHTGPVTIDGTLDVVNRITGTGGIAITNAFGPAGASSYLTGSFTVTGGDIVADGYSLKLHKHTGVQGGSSTSGPATP